ncbi:MAG TPA: AMP-binding protein [Dokdonella sp.]|uniref:AMP-binding protein n=1 Tax=Dokdonella sp. TaxID=2291710 RepID=UPI002C0575BE|nr:AMP-binding protein [Dokdonella sp.]HUD43694.1 AMP-binding protein [Dokdonella sp.]
MNKPLWEPSDERIERANLNRFMRFVREQTGNEDIRRYAPLYDFSIRHPTRFWPLVWEFCGIRASGDFEPVLTEAEHMADARWFPEVRLNVAQNLLRHRDDRIALIDRDAHGAQRSLSYAALHGEVARLAAALGASGVASGDRIASTLQGGLERVIALLATTAVGAIWAPCPHDGAGLPDTTYLAALAPKLLFLGGERAVASAAALREAAPSIGTIVTTASAATAPGLVTWDAFAAGDAQHPAFEPLPFAHPLYVLPAAVAASATTEGLVHGAGGVLIQHLKDLVLQLDLKREDRIVVATGDLATWHWLVSALAVGATLVFVDEATAAGSEALWNVLDEIGASVLVTRSDALAASAAAGLAPMQTHKLQHLRTIVVTGPVPPPEAYDYVYTAIKQRVLLCAVAGGPDLLSCLATGNPLLPIHRGELQGRSLGLRVEVIDADGHPQRDRSGALACLAPFPALPLGYWNDAGGQRYRRDGFAGAPGSWRPGLQAQLTPRDGLLVSTTAAWPVAASAASAA